jgi:ribulose-5-phosphate 4-epimerase/fuculose-1-phosphate aldolase
MDQNARERDVGAIEESERRGRVELAATFRIGNRLGWNEGVANHFSLMLPGSTDRFLINPRGVHFAEITASKLMVIDQAGRILKGQGQLRPVAFRLHGRLHKARPDARCIIHAHPPYATALSMVKGGRIQPAHANAMMFHNRVAYDDELGGPVSDTELDRVEKLVEGKTVIVHGMHGLTTLAPTVAKAFDQFYFFERLAKCQFIAMQSGQQLHAIPDEIAGQFKYDDGGQQPDNYQVHLDAWMRILDREEPDYRN